MTEQEQDSQSKTPPVMVSQLSQSKILRVVYICLALLSLGVGMVGVIVPGLPTTEFVLLAAFFASKGSARLHAWFYHHKIFGPMIRDWQDHKRISRKSKYMATLSMSIAAAILIWKVPHLPSVVISIGCMMCVLVWLWTRSE